ncbi:hypothetical protein [Haloarcula rubripromontorii]|uniref:hypothetical protein n=1 Tax=Haloarcula rubripromontorii TaxID=1705562 RepID=UPI000A9F7B8D|nr:hypothetical protein [Haloarcula rubripromontorii]
MQLLGGPSWDKQTTTYGTVHVHEKRGPDTAGGRVGLRRSEIIGVYPQDFVDRPTGDHIRVWESYAKQDKYRELPVPKGVVTIAETLAYQQDDDDPLLDIAGSTVYRWVRRTADVLEEDTGDKG